MKILANTLFFLIMTSCAHKQSKVIVAHRGAPGYLPEHTLEGFTLAHSWDIDFLEPDLVVTKDNKLVVLHDIHLDTNTDVAIVYPKRSRKDGRYYVVDFKLSELKKLSVSERINIRTKKQVYPKRFIHGKSHFQIPTLIEFIELVQGLNRTRNKEVGIIPEIKSPEFHLKNGKDITKLTVEVLRHYGYDKTGSNIYIQSFYPPTLKRLRDEFKLKIPLLFLIAENEWGESSIDYNIYKTENGIKSISMIADAVGPYAGSLLDGNKSDIVELAHKYNMKVFPYTHRVDELPKQFSSSKEFLNYMFNDLKADGIFSDFADQAKKEVANL